MPDLSHGGFIQVFWMPQAEEPSLPRALGFGEAVRSKTQFPGARTVSKRLEDHEPQHIPWIKPFGQGQFQGVLKRGRALEPRHRFSYQDQRTSRADKSGHHVLKSLLTPLGHPCLNPSFALSRSFALPGDLFSCLFHGCPKGLDQQGQVFILHGKLKVGKRRRVIDVACHAHRNASFEDGPPH